MIRAVKEKNCRRLRRLIEGSKSTVINRRANLQTLDWRQSNPAHNCLSIILRLKSKQPGLGRRRLTQQARERGWFVVSILTKHPVNDISFIRELHLVRKL